VHVYVFIGAREKLSHGHSWDLGHARAGSTLCAHHSGERILNRSTVARSIIGASTTLMDVGRMLGTGLIL
jgi:hypothetical protein